ncbi:MAG: adenylate/guanylate cyclase domain-containing protein [Pannonibacter sp.]
MAEQPDRPDRVGKRRLGWIGGPALADLPARVRLDVQRRELEAERLIGWVQLSIVLLFSLLYAIAPRAEGSDGTNFVPSILAAYLAFTLVRLILSYRIELPQWYLFVSIAVDVGLLVGLIFSFHIQYAQPPSFYLKVPTLMYVFIFIGLRALRFDPRFVIVSGLAAAVGWMGLVVYAITGDDGRMRITRNYVEYLTGNSVLLGAEFDKILVILTVTGLLAAALYRGRGLLVTGMREQGAANDLRRFFAPEVASSITSADRRLNAGEGVLRDAAILYVDVRGFTRQAANLPPQTVMQVLACYQETAIDVIEAHGGSVDKFLGDGILATFGALSPSATYAADAIAAAQAIVARLSADAGRLASLGWPGAFRVGTAVCCGTVAVGLVGGQDRLEFTVIGDAVNRAAKLENANKTEGSSILTDVASFELASAQGYAGGSGVVRRSIPVAGLEAPVDLVILG